MQKHIKKRPRKLVAIKGEFKSYSSAYAATLAKQVAAELGSRRPAAASRKKKVRG